MKPARHSFSNTLHTRIEGDFTGARNIRIFYQAWLPEGDAKAVVLVVHGLGEHSGRCKNVVNHLVPLGFAVYSFDHAGHGRSAGRRGYIDRLDDYTATLAISCSRVQAWQPGKPLFLLGHSMGGLIASLFLLDHQALFNGAILSAPSLLPGKGVSPTQGFMTRLLSVLAPAAGVLKLDARGISRDPQVVADYVDDPLVFHGRISARLAAELLRGMQRVLAEAERIALPLLILQGSADTMVAPAGAQRLHDQAGSRDKTLRFFDDLRHEVFNEPEHAQVLAVVARWLAAHLQRCT